MLQFKKVTCLEKYDVFDVNDVQIGSLRFEDGHLTIHSPNSDGDLIYEAGNLKIKNYEELKTSRFMTAVVKAIEDWRGN